MLEKILGFTVLTLISSITYAGATNFNCPDPSQIVSTDFTAPSIWTAPPVAHAAPGTVGIGLGGKVVKELLGAEPARIGNKRGWVCVYRSEGGVSVNSYESIIKQDVKNTSFLKQYLARVDKFFDNAEPYLKKYPKNIPLGVVGYQLDK